MKKTVLFLLALLIAMSSVACGGGGDNDGKGGGGGEREEYADNYLYTMIGSVLYRISPYSATVVPMCPDPLCFHNDASCPFYGVEEIGFVEIGKYMYYLKDYGGFGEYMKKLCRFDRESGKFEVIYDPEEGSLTQMSVNGTELYFNLAYTDEELKNEFDVCRYDHLSGRIDILTDEALKSEQDFITERDGRLYWESCRTNEYYSTDRNYKDRIDGDRTANAVKVIGDLYYRLGSLGLYKDTYEYCYNLTAVNSVSGEEKVILDELSSVPIIYGGKIIYSKFGEPKYLGLTLYEDYDEPKELYDHSGGRYYICDPDGSNERLLCDLDGTGCAVPLHADMIGNSGVGDWIAIDAYHYTEPDENGIIERDNNVYLLINIVTGEVKVAEVEKRN